MRDKGMIPPVEKNGMIPSMTTMKKGLNIEDEDEKKQGMEVVEKKGIIPSKMTIKEGLNIEYEDEKKQGLEVVKMSGKSPQMKPMMDKGGPMQDKDGDD
eukprot:15541499-Heterocapsa_arctica.AAC.1